MRDTCDNRSLNVPLDYAWTYSVPGKFMFFLNATTNFILKLDSARTWER